MGVTVRLARSGDGAAIAAAWLSAATYYAELDPAHFQVPQANDWDDQLAVGHEGELWLVAEVDGRVIGWLSARLELPEADAAAQLTREPGWTRLMVDALIVHRGYWRHGTGTALLEAAEAWGRDRGARVSRLDTYAHSPISVSFYEHRMGYQRRSIVFQKPL